MLLRTSSHFIGHALPTFPIPIHGHTSKGKHTTRIFLNFRLASHRLACPHRLLSSWRSAELT